MEVCNPGADMTQVRAERLRAAALRIDERLIETFNGDLGAWAEARGVEGVEELTMLLAPELQIVDE